MRWLTVIEWSIYVPPLELSIASFECLGAWRISVIIVARSASCEILDAIVVISLITFADQTDIWSLWDAMDWYFLSKISFQPLLTGGNMYSKHSTSLCKLLYSSMAMNFMSCGV